MHRYSVLMASGFLGLLLVGLQLSLSMGTTPIQAEVNIHPEIFNLKRGGVITARVSNLTREDVSYPVTNVNVSTITLRHEETLVAEPLRVTVAGNNLIVKFDATTATDYILFRLFHMGIVPPIPPQANRSMTFTVKGELFSGDEFAGSDTVSIIFP